ncbi:lysylphosphatidylglycerol synthase transmembrane domain-containing protein [Roseivirga echinicomitans]
MEKPKLKKWLKLAAQIIIAVVAIYFVIGEVDLEEYKKRLLGVNVAWLALAILAFNASKILGAFRLNHFFRAIQLQLNSRFNLKLYYVGMLYNQIFPGGIGGDGYKVYLLNKRYKAPLKGLIAATLLDRISGVVALGFLAFLLALIGGKAYGLMEGYGFLIWVALIVAYPCYYILVHFVFPSFKKVNHITNLQALGLQSLQVLCAFFMLKSLGVTDGYLDYFTLFLISSVAAAFPISLPGGLGVREGVMVMGSAMFMLNESAAAAFASLFFLITLFSSLIGLVYLRQIKSVEVKEKV